mmetsp:Transcript_70122/g.203330  ORF Transcript_70122/g.203330 Transcript_70122/m.203330 type:complete len:273 (+) Transcript_70122:546-1364(+)
MRPAYPALCEYCSTSFGRRCSIVHCEPKQSAISLRCWVAAWRTECTLSRRLARYRVSSFDLNISTPKRRANFGTCSTTLWRTRQWLSMIRFWIVWRSVCTKPSTDKTSQIMPACETMLRRTSWNSSFMRSDTSVNNCRCVTSRPKNFATGPRTWARAARTGWPASSPKAWNCGRTYCCSCSEVKSLPDTQGSMTRTASLRTSCSLSRRSWTKACMRLEAVISGPNEAHNLSKFFATVRRTLHDRSSIASSITDNVCCLLSSGSSILAITNVV